jgi:DNA-binding FadR family transcriptional regulator
LGDGARTFPRRSLHGQVAHDLGRRILSGLVKPGDFLPSETELSHRLGVSRTALREAIKVLAGKGLIESRPKTGTRVRPREAWNFLDPDVLSWACDSAAPEQYVDSINELRLVIEPAAAALAAERATPEDVSRMEEALGAMGAAGTNLAALIGPDKAFHRAILQATGNEMFRSLGNIVEMALTIALRAHMTNPASYRSSLALHGTIFKAIRRGDAHAARKAAQLLIEVWGRSLRGNLLARTDANRVKRARS